MAKRNPVALALMKNPSRGLRRHEDKRAKAESKHKLQRFGLDNPTPRQVGAAASQHNTCDCWACTLREPDDRQNVRDLMLLQYE